MVGPLYPDNIIEIKEERYPHKWNTMVGFWKVKEVYGDLIYVTHILYEDIQTEKKGSNKDKLARMLFRRCDVDQVW